MLATSYRVYISQLIRFARVSSHVADVNTLNKSLTMKLLTLEIKFETSKTQTPLLLF